MSGYGYSYKNKSEGTVSLIILIVFIAITFGGCCIQNSNERTEIGTVTDKYVKDDRYLVYCEDENGEVDVYEVDDTLIYGRVNSSDDFGRIHVGETYEFTVVGSRAALISWYPNIIDLKEIEEDLGGTENE